MTDQVSQVRTVVAQSLT